MFKYNGKMDMYIVIQMGRYMDSWFDHKYTQRLQEGAPDDTRCLGPEPAFRMDVV